MRHAIGVVLVAAAAATAAGCDGQVPPTTPTPPAPTVTETFSGTLTLNGGQTVTFTTAAAGVVTARLSILNPDSTTIVSLALGIWTGISCNVVIANDKATQGITVTGNVSGAGALCARIADVGMLTQSQTFEIVVVHP